MAEVAAENAGVVTEVVAESVEESLVRLEREVEAMLAVRTGMTVHKDGPASKKGETTTESRGNESRGQDGEASQETSISSTSSMPSIEP